jgi:lincosamide nucleotidyltransferase A/C/D/E
MMQAGDVIELLDVLESAGVSACVDGGWGVDALVGEQTREHDDLDVVIDIGQVEASIAALTARGFAVVEDERPTRVVVRDGRDRRIDVHPVRLDAQGGGTQTLQDGREFRYSPNGLAGRGSIAGRAVRCISAEVQVRCHLGYEPDEKDLHDMCLLRDRLAVALPPPYDGLSSLL